MAALRKGLKTRRSVAPAVYEDENDEGQTENKNLTAKIERAKAGKVSSIFCAQPNIDQSELDGLIAFKELEYLKMPRVTFPIEAIVSLKALKQLEVGSVVLPSGQSKLGADALKKLLELETFCVNNPMSFEHLSKFITCHACVIPAANHFHINGEITEEMMSQLGKTVALDRLIIETENPVELSWFTPQTLTKQLVIKAPLSSPPENDENTKKLYDHLELHNCLAVSNFAFLNKCPKLSKLALRLARQLTMEDLEVAFQWNITMLDLSGSKLTDTLLDKIVQKNIILTSFVAVRDVGNDEGTGFTNRGIERFLGWNKNNRLKRLEISGHQNITVDAFENIKCLKSLNWLGLRETACTNAALVFDHFALRRLALMPGAGQTARKLPTLEIAITTSGSTTSDVIAQLQSVQLAAADEASLLEGARGNTRRGKNSADVKPSDFDNDWQMLERNDCSGGLVAGAGVSAESVGEADKRTTGGEGGFAAGPAEISDRDSGEPPDNPCWARVNIDNREWVIVTAANRRNSGLKLASDDRIIVTRADHREFLEELETVSGSTNARNEEYVIVDLRHSPFEIAKSNSDGEAASGASDTSGSCGGASGNRAGLNVKSSDKKLQMAQDVIIHINKLYRNARITYRCDFADPKSLDDFLDSQ
jgi:hypothetical protein